MPHKQSPSPAWGECLDSYVSQSLYNSNRCCYIQKKSALEFDIAYYSAYSVIFCHIRLWIEYEFTIRSTIRTEQNTNRIFGAALVFDDMIESEYVFLNPVVVIWTIEIIHQSSPLVSVFYYRRRVLTTTDIAGSFPCFNCLWSDP